MRKYLQYRLSHIFMVVTLAAMSVAMWCWWNRNERAIQALEGSGAQLTWIDTKGGTNKNITPLEESKKYFSIEITEQWRGGNGGLRHLSNVKQLRELYVFEDSGVTDAGVAHIGELSELERLTLWSRRVTDRGIRHLIDLKGLRRLDLAGLRIGDESLATFHEMSELEELILSETLVRGDGLANLHPNIRRLHLYDTEVDDKAVVHLLSLPQLRYLGLYGTRVTDEGFLRLALLPNLENIIVGTRITKAACQSFERRRETAGLGSIVLARIDF